MRTLLVLRHAKSAWDTGVDDHSRPLAKRGRKAAARVGRFLAIAGPMPDLVVTSTATRARDTAERVARAGDLQEVPMHPTDALYDTSSDGALSVIRALPDESETALVVGHEPTLSDLVAELIGGGTVAMVTGALATISFDAASWREVGVGTGRLERLVPPRSLKGLGLRRAVKNRDGAPARDDDDGA